MLKQFHAGFGYMMLDYRYSLFIFWTVLISSTIALFVFSLSTPNAHMNLAFGLATTIYCAISGFQMTKETLPFFLKLSSTRKNFIVSSFLFILALSLFMAIVATSLTYVFNQFSTWANMDNFSVMLLTGFMTPQMSWLNEVWLIFILSFFAQSIGFMFSSLFYRTGLIGGFSGLAFMIILFLIPDVRSAILDLLVSFENSRLLLNNVVIIIIACLTLIPNWLLIKKAPTRSAATR